MLIQPATEPVTDSPSTLPPTPGSMLCKKVTTKVTTDYNESHDGLLPTLRRGWGVRGLGSLVWLGGSICRRLYEPTISHGPTVSQTAKPRDSNARSVPSRREYSGRCSAFRSTSFLVTCIQRDTKILMISNILDFNELEPNFNHT